MTKMGGEDDKKNREENGKSLSCQRVRQKRHEKVLEKRQNVHRKVLEKDQKVHGKFLKKSQKECTEISKLYFKNTVRKKFCFETRKMGIL